jgi:putative N6-adenine-specific DNA methylase
MVKVARYRGREPFIDPFCGSGTIAIDAAMAALNIAPGARRSLDAEAWEFFDNRVFAREKQAAIAAERYEKLPIVASDLDKRAVAQTRENARRAGVLDYITVEQADAAKREYPETGTLIANPPYGVRMLDIKQARLLAAAFGAATAGKKGLKKYIISADNISLYRTLHVFHKFQKYICAIFLHIVIAFLHHLWKKCKHNKAKN